MSAYDNTPRTPADAGASSVWDIIIQRKTLISMLFLALTMLGYISYRGLPVENMPSVVQPELSVSVRVNGSMGPEYIQQQAVIPLEGAIGALEGIDEITSNIQQQQASISISYNQNVDVRFAQIKLQQAVDTVRQGLPDEFSVSVNTGSSGGNVSNQFMSLDVRGTGGLERIRKVVDESIADELGNIEGITSVEVVGGEEQAVEVILDAVLMEQYGMTPSTVRNAINNSQAQEEYLGQAYYRTQSVPVNLIGEYTDVHDIEDIILDPTGPVSIKDLASVYYGAKEQTTISRVNGMEAVTMRLVSDGQSNLISLSNATKAVIAQLNHDLAPQEMEIAIQSNAADEIEENINLIINLAVTGAFFAAVVLWFFLGNIKLVLVVMLAVPISVYSAFNLFYAYDISINSLTLVGIALAVGMLLNSSIVVLENIFRHVTLRRPLNQAVTRGTSEVWRPLFASTLTTVTVFVPFLFSSDYNVQTIGRHVGISIISTLVISLVVALLLVPMIAHTILRRTDARRATLFTRVSHRNRLYQIYTVILKSALRFPARTVVGALVLFFATLFICLVTSVEVPTEAETDTINIYVTMPSGSTLEAADEAVAEIEAFLFEIEELEEVAVNIYEEEADLTLRLADKYEKINERTFGEISDYIEDWLDDFRLADAELEEPTSSARYSQGMGRNATADMMRMFNVGTASETIILKGNDFDLLVRVANSVKYQLDQLESLSNESSLSTPRETQELRMLVDNSLLTLHGIPVSNVVNELSSSSGQMTASATYTQGTEEYDIVIEPSDYDEEEDQQQDVQTLDDIRNIGIPTQGSEALPLENLVQFLRTSSKSSITRINQEQQVELTYSFTDEITESKTYLQYARDEVDQLVASLPIPAGVAIEVLHNENDLSEMYYLIGGAFILIFMILASVFESMTAPVVMMFTIPLAGIGAFIALIITGNSLYSANSLIGLLILVGVVVNNGIMLIDYARILRERGFTLERALIASGQARVRPILITAITTIVAMFPLAMGNTGSIGQIGAPFAITVIGGLALSALFTLVFIPTVYSALESALTWFRGLSLKARLAQALAFVFGLYLIYNYVNDIIWQIADFIALLFVVPSGAYFLMTTLRQARSDIVKPGDALHIRVRRLVKVYDDYSRFVREWKKGERLKQLVIGKTHKTARELFDPYRWQIPLLGFQVYFIFFYLKQPFWQFVLVHFLYSFMFLMLKPVTTVLNDRAEAQGREHSRLAYVLHRIMFWGFPVLMLWAFHLLEFRVLTLVFITGFWGLPLIIATTSDRLHHGNVNIMRLKGRFSGIRRKWYQLVMAIPIIGRKRKPFKALNTVSLEIGNGMFGLLGPNGAGKTTIMRTICGILEQSMGRLYVNDADANEEREELQGLIGYLPQEFGTYENMSAYEFLDYLAILKGITDTKTRRERIEYVLSNVHLWDVRDRKIGSFSGGMKQRVGIALTLLHLPRIMVVDEPTAGLDPRERIRFRNLLVELSRERIVIFSTHIIEDISSSCNRVAVLHRGNLRYHGNPNAMTAAAEGKVWQFLMKFSDFEAHRHELRIVHHIQVGNEIRVRALADLPPVEDAQQVKPTLEDAYLWLLGGKPAPETELIEGGGDAA